MSRQPWSKQLTRREERARAKLLDAATELAAALGDAETTEGSWVIEASLAEAMNDLYRANDEWQEAQIAARHTGKRGAA